MYLLDDIFNEFEESLDLTDTMYESIFNGIANAMNNDLYTESYNDILMEASDASGGFFGRLINGIKNVVSSITNAISNACSSSDAKSKIKKLNAAIEKNPSMADKKVKVSDINKISAIYNMYIDTYKKGMKKISKTKYKNQKDLNKDVTALKSELDRIATSLNSNNDIVREYRLGDVMNNMSKNMGDVKKNCKDLEKEFNNALIGVQKEVGLDPDKLAATRSLSSSSSKMTGKTLKVVAGVAGGLLAAVGIAMAKVKYDENMADPDKALDEYQKHTDAFNSYAKKLAVNELNDKVIKSSESKIDRMKNKANKRLYATFTTAMKTSDLGRVRAEQEGMKTLAEINKIVSDPNKADELKILRKRYKLFKDYAEDSEKATEYYADTLAKFISGRPENHKPAPKYRNGFENMSNEEVLKKIKETK